MNFDHLIKNFEQISLSNDDILHALKNKVNIILYEDLLKTQDILDLFKPEYENRVILFFPENSRKTGHWVCMWYENSILDFFDPYGSGIDENINISAYLAMAPDKTKYALKNLVDKYQQKGGKLNINRIRFQLLEKSVNTCGRHCICRLLLNELSNIEYYNYLKNKNMSFDYIVSLLTFTSSFY